jgi:DNA polymerase-3 subunit epsilon
LALRKNKMNLGLPWREQTFVAFDTETTGKYPLVAEICEIAAVKWRGGEVVETFQALVKPVKLMGEAVIRIHHITNEMVSEAPGITEVLPKFNEFIKDSTIIAHHAAFDLGFLAHEYERHGIALPPDHALDTLALSLKAFPTSQNHKLSTLIAHLGLKMGQAHRALEDSRACLEVALKCMEKLGDDASLEYIFKAQGGPFEWQRFSMSELLKSDIFRPLVEGSKNQLVLEIVYTGGSQPGVPRRMTPQGLVRNHSGDYVVGLCHRENVEKRFYLNRILSAKILD